MRINVTFRHTDPTDAIKEYAHQKLGKVKKYLSEPIDMNVVLSVEKFRHTAEVTLSSDGKVINCEEETEDMYSAIDRVTVKLERQIKKAKGRIQTKRAQNKPDAAENQ